MNKEEIYDAQIAPLMGQIIDICREHKIAMLADFAIPNDNDKDLRCTTALLREEYDPSERALRALAILKPEQRSIPSPLMFTVDNGDGTKTMTAVCG